MKSRVYSTSYYGACTHLEWIVDHVSLWWVGVFCWILLLPCVAIINFLPSQVIWFLVDCTKTLKYFYRKKVWPVILASQHLSWKTKKALLGNGNPHCNITRKCHSKQRVREQNKSLVTLTNCDESINVFVWHHYRCAHTGQGSQKRYWIYKRLGRWARWTTFGCRLLPRAPGLEMATGKNIWIYF